MFFLQCSLYNRLNAKTRCCTLVLPASINQFLGRGVVNGVVQSMFVPNQAHKIQIEIDMTTSDFAELLVFSQPKMHEACGNPTIS